MAAKSKQTLDEIREVSAEFTYFEMGSCNETLEISVCRLAENGTTDLFLRV
jgi:hypothetical protein